MRNTTNNFISTSIQYKPMIDPTDIINTIADLFQEIPFIILLMACDMLLAAVGSVTKIDYLPLFAIIINTLLVGAQVKYTAG